MTETKRANAERWLLSKGWLKSGQWWLPPNGPTGHYKSKCYRLEEAVRTETGLRDCSEAGVYNDQYAGY